MLYIFLIFGASLFAFMWWHDQQRNKGLRAVAVRLGLHYLGEALPRSLSLSSPMFKNVTKIWNVIDGDRNGHRVISFDYRTGSGKHSTSKTVMAVDIPPAHIETLLRYSNLSIESRGNWSFLSKESGGFLTSRQQVIPVPELESYLVSLLSSSSQ